MSGHASGANLVDDGKSLLEVAFTLSDTFPLCQDYERGGAELHVLNRRTGTWSELKVPNSINGIHYKQVEDKIYVQMGPNSVSSLRLPDGDLVPEPKIRDVQQLDEPHDAIDPGSPIPLRSTNAASGLTAEYLHNGTNDRSNDTYTLTVATGTDRITVDGSRQVFPTDAGVFLRERNGDRFLITKASEP